MIYDEGNFNDKKEEEGKNMEKKIIYVGNDCALMGTAIVQTKSLGTKLNGNFFAPDTRSNSKIKATLRSIDICSRSHCHVN